MLHKWRGIQLDPSDFEGTLVLEKLAQIGKVDEFFAAIDSDDYRRVVILLRQAQVDSESILAVIKEATRV